MLAHTSIFILLFALGATETWKIYFLSPPPDDLLGKCNNGSANVPVSDDDVNTLQRKRREESVVKKPVEKTDPQEIVDSTITDEITRQSSGESNPRETSEKPVPAINDSGDGAKTVAPALVTEAPAAKTEVTENPKKTTPTLGKLTENVAVTPSVTESSPTGLLNVSGTFVASFPFTTLVYSNSVNNVELVKTTTANLSSSPLSDNETTKSQPKLTSSLNHENHPTRTFSNFDRLQEPVFGSTNLSVSPSESSGKGSTLTSLNENKSVTSVAVESEEVASAFAPLNEKETQPVSVVSKSTEPVPKTTLQNEMQSATKSSTVSMTDSVVPSDTTVHVSTPSILPSSSKYSPRTNTAVPPSSTNPSFGVGSSSVVSSSSMAHTNLDLSSQQRAQNVQITNSHPVNTSMISSSISPPDFMSTSPVVVAVHDASTYEMEVNSSSSVTKVVSTSLVTEEKPKTEQPKTIPSPPRAFTTEPSSPSTAKVLEETTIAPVVEQKKDFVKYECNADDSSISHISNSVTCNNAAFWAKSCFAIEFGKCLDRFYDDSSVMNSLRKCICNDNGTDNTVDCSNTEKSNFSCDESETWKLSADSILCLPVDLVKECCAVLPTPEVNLQLESASPYELKFSLSMGESDLWQVVEGDIEYCRTQLDEQPLIQLPPGASDSGSGYDCQRSPHFSKLNPGRCFDVTVHLKFQMKVKTDQRLSSASKTIQSACTNPLAPKEVPAPDIDSESLAIEIYRPQDQTNGKVECYYVLLLKMAHTETIDDLQVEFLDGFFDKYRRAEKSLDMEKLRPYITMAVPAFNEPSKRIAFSTSESTAAPAMTSCGACVQVNNTLLQPGRYLVVVAAAVNTSHKSDAMCGHMQTLTRKSSYVSMDYVLHHESGFNMWIPVAVLTVILFLSLLVLSLLFFTRNGRCNQIPLISKLRIGGSNDMGDARVDEPDYSGMGSSTRGGLMGSRSNHDSNLAILQANVNGFHAIVNPNHHPINAQVDPQKRQQADNDFRNTLIEEYGPEYLEDRRKCKMELTPENAKCLIERKCTTPHFYYTFYKSRCLPCPGQLLEPEPKYKELTQWDFEFERIAHDGYMEGETPPPQVLNDPAVIKINKFSDVCPYEFNRVKLTYGVKDNPNFDRTNGSLIQFPGLNTRFIAIQGPDQGYYINQFWQIVYEYNCDVIVMLASFNVASGKDGVQYWPDFDDHEGATQIYGNYTVTMTDKRSIYSYMDHRVFQVTLTPVNNKNSDVLIEGLGNDDDSSPDGDCPGRRGSGSSSQYSGSQSAAGGCMEPGETKIVHHFHFTMWNDYGIPTDTSSFWSFMDTAMSYHDMPECPVLVHCRAGIGRTGTFIASNYLRDLLDRDSRVDVHKFVWQLRAQRKKFVQKVCQYRFIHQALLEHILFSRSRLNVSSILSSSFNSQSIKSSILRQLQDIEFVEKYREHHLEKEKGDYNGREETFPRDFQKVPYKYNFVRFPADIVHEVYSSYLNASWICGFNDELKRFIVTDLPYEVKHKTFWWMVLQHRISYIVYIGDLPMDGQKKEAPYWPDTENQVLKFGRINVRLVAKYDFMPTEGMVDSSPTGINNNNGPIGCSKPNRSTKAIIRQLALTVTDDDEILARGEEWQITHVQYLFLEGSTGPPLNSCHFAHFVSLIRRDLIGSCQLQQQRGQPSPNLNVLPNRRGACNCVLKRRFRDSLMNRCSSNCDDPSLLSCDCSKPLVVQCLTGGLRSALFCAIWVLSQDLEQTKSCNVPAVIHRLLEQRFTIFPYRTTDIDCFNFIYDCLKSICSGSFEGENDYHGRGTSAGGMGHLRSPSSDVMSSSNSSRTPFLPLTPSSGSANGGYPNNNSHHQQQPSLYNGHSNSPYTSNASLRLPTPNSPQAQMESMSFSNNLAKNSPSPRSTDPAGSHPDSTPFSFSTFKKNRNKGPGSGGAVDAASNIDGLQETSIV